MQMLAQYLKSKGIVHQTTVPYNPEQNSAAERLNRTLMEQARAIFPREKRQKLVKRNICGVMVGYAADTKGYRILLEDHTVIISRNVIFDEGTGATKLRGHQPQVQGDDSESEH